MSEEKKKHGSHHYDKPCGVIIAPHQDKVRDSNINWKEIKTELEKGDIPEKKRCIKTIIVSMLNGETVPPLLMPIIQYAMTKDDKELKKLLLIYWEIVEKTNSQGKLLPELVLVCNNLRNDLNHANEYIRGTTLRLMSKLREQELFEPLLPSIIANLEYKHAYVRRNAVLALYNVYKHFEHLCPDAPDRVFNFLHSEADPTCKRNGFIMLYNTSPEKAILYMSEILDQVSSMGEIIQFIVVDLIKKVCKTNPNEKGKYIRCVFSLLNSGTSAVKFEAAGALISLSSAPSAIKAAAQTFIELLVRESDNNVKLVCLEKIESLKANYKRILQDLLLDLLRALQSPSLDIRKKTLDIALNLVTPKNIEEAILVLKKEITKSQSKEIDKGPEYRQMLIKAIHTCATQFPDIAETVIHLLMDFVGDSSASSLDVIYFVREVVELYPNLRKDIVKRLIESLDQIRSVKVYRTSLWIIGEYSESGKDIDLAFTQIRKQIGKLPFIETEEEKEETKEEESIPNKNENKNTVENKNSTPSPNKSTPNKTKKDSKKDYSGLKTQAYSTQSAVSIENSQEKESIQKSTDPNLTKLRKHILEGEWFLCAVLISSLTKLALKSQTISEISPIMKNLVTTQVLLVMTSIVRYGQSSECSSPIEPDSLERIIFCAKVLTNPSSITREVFLKESRESFHHFVTEQEKVKPKKEIFSEFPVVQSDDCLKIRQLKKDSTYQSEVDDDDLEQATGIHEYDKDEDLSNLGRIYQLTGYSDPIYAEAYINVHTYDISLDVLVINQTPETLQNVSLELATLGDLKLLEKPQPVTISAHDKNTIHANIKIASTETGVIFGNIVFDIAGVSSSDKNCVILNDIHIDALDYIQPADCSYTDFLSMWAEFEWENRIVVNTNITDLKAFLQHICKSTNMKCLTPESNFNEECGFLSANLYARSVFGEDALANISIEMIDQKISGFIRLRSRTQGIALSLGDKITSKQRVDNLLIQEKVENSVIEKEGKQEED